MDSASGCLPRSIHSELPDHVITGWGAGWATLISAVAVAHELKLLPVSADVDGFLAFLRLSPKTRHGADFVELFVCGMQGIHNMASVRCGQTPGGKVHVAVLAKNCPFAMAMLVKLGLASFTHLCFEFDVGNRQSKRVDPQPSSYMKMNINSSSLCLAGLVRSLTGGVMGSDEQHQWGDKEVKILDNLAGEYLALESKPDGLNRVLDPRRALGVQHQKPIVRVLELASNRLCDYLAKHCGCCRARILWLESGALPHLQAELKSFGNARTAGIAVSNFRLSDEASAECFDLVADFHIKTPITSLLEVINFNASKLSAKNSGVAPSGARELSLGLGTAHAKSQDWVCVCGARTSFDFVRCKSCNRVKGAQSWEVMDPVTVTKCPKSGQELARALFVAPVPGSPDLAEVRMHHSHEVVTVSLSEVTPDVSVFVVNVEEGGYFVSNTPHPRVPGSDFGSGGTGTAPAEHASCEQASPVSAELSNHPMDGIGEPEVAEGHAKFNATHLPMLHKNLYVGCAKFLKDAAAMAELRLEGNVCVIFLDGRVQLPEQPDTRSVVCCCLISCHPIPPPHTPLTASQMAPTFLSFPCSSHFLSFSLIFLFLSFSLIFSHFMFLSFPLKLYPLRYHYFDIEDGSAATLGAQGDHAAATLDYELVNHDGPVVVACFKGLSRGPSICCLWKRQYCLYKNLQVEEIMSIVRQLRAPDAHKADYISANDPARVMQNFEQCIRGTGNAVDAAVGGPPRKKPRTRQRASAGFVSGTFEYFGQVHTVEYGCGANSSAEKEQEAQRVVDILKRAKFRGQVICIRLRKDEPMPGDEWRTEMNRIAQTHTTLYSTDTGGRLKLQNFLTGTHVMNILDEKASNPLRDGLFECQSQTAFVFRAVINDGQLSADFDGFRGFLQGDQRKEGGVATTHFDGHDQLIALIRGGCKEWLMAPFGALSPEKNEPNCNRGFDPSDPHDRPVDSGM
jgi:hypothetical protein